MINPEQIPDEVIEAAAKEIAMTCRCEMACDWRSHLEEARAAIAAALAAWPGMQQRPFWDLMTHARHVEIILPQEARDE